MLFFSWHSPAYTQQTKGIFYQPLTRDNVLTDDQWQSLILALKADSISHIIFQWSEYDDVLFTGKDEVIDVLIRLLQEHSMTWSLGLKMPLDYYTVLEQGNAEDKRLLISDWLNQNRRHMMRLTIAGFPKRQGFVGWYLSLELTDPYFEGSLLEVWGSGINSLLNETPHPLAISYFPPVYGGQNSFVQLYKALNQPRLEIMVQLSNGLLDADERLRNLDLPCNVSIIIENFMQVSKSSPLFIAEKKAISDLGAKYECYDRYIFSLRYQSYSKHLQLQD